MNYRVIWDTDAFQKLTKIWDDAYDREAVAHAIDEITDQLRLDADRQGESRDERRRVSFSWPLGVMFRAEPRLAEVLIIAVWTYSRKGR